MEINQLLKCFCKARETQAYFSKCLNIEGISEEEREILYDIVESTAKASNKLVKMCNQMEDWSFFLPKNRTYIPVFERGPLWGISKVKGIAGSTFI